MRRFSLTIAAVAANLCCLIPAKSRGADTRGAPASLATGDLEQTFLTPPDSAKPSGWWFWFYNLMDKEGITRDSAIVAFPEPEDLSLSATDERRASLQAKSNRKDSGIGGRPAEIMGATLVPWANKEEDHPLRAEQVVDLTKRVTAEGILDWEVPPGRWTILRTGHRLTWATIRMPTQGFDRNGQPLARPAHWRRGPAGRGAKDPQQHSFRQVAAIAFFRPAWSGPGAGGGMNASPTFAGWRRGACGDS